MIARLLTALFRHRRPAAAAILLLVAGMAVPAARVGVDNRLEVWFVEDDPTLRAYRDFLDRFGSDEVVVTAIRGTGDALSADRLSRLSRLTHRLDTLGGVSRVLSLTTLADVYARAAPASLFRGRSPLAQLRASVEEGGLAARLVGTDRRTLVVLAWLDPETDRSGRRGEVLSQIEALARTALAPGESAHAGGVGVVYEALNRETYREGALFIGGSYLVIVLLLGLVLRRALWVLLAVLVVTMADVTLLGVMGLLERPLNAVTLALPALVAVLGVSTVVHLARSAEEALRARAGDATPADVLAALARVAWPCLFNALTTAGGFLSLQSAHMAVTRDYGLFAALGVMLAFGFGLVGTVVLAPRAARLRPLSRDASPLDGVAVRAVGLALRRPARVTTIAAVLAAVALLGASRIRVDTHSMDFLPAGHPVQADGRALERFVGPYVPLELVVEARAPGAWKEPAFLEALARAQAALAAMPGIGAAASVGDLLCELRRASGGGSVPPDWAPATRAETERLLALAGRVAGPALLRPLVAADDRTIRLTATVPMTSARGFAGQTAHAERAAARALEGHASVRAGGYLPLYGALTERVVQDQTRSFAWAFVVVFALVALVLRSGRLTLAAIPPNVLPVLAVLGLMGFAGIRLDLATVTVAAAVLGVVVDDTVHLLHRTREGLRESRSIDDAMREAARTSGGAVISTSLVLCAGFGVIAFAGVRSVGYVGLLTAVAIFVALLADLLLLPALTTLLFRVQGSRLKVESARTLNFEP